MADYPRWIYCRRVDSTAMYTAYLKNIKPTDPHYGLLDFIVHRAPVPLATRQDVKVVQCTAKNCVRCQNGVGGYQFRWYNVQWGSDYLRFMRKNSKCWLPGEDEYD